MLVRIDRSRTFFIDYTTPDTAVKMKQISKYVSIFYELILHFVGKSCLIRKSSGFIINVVFCLIARRCFRVTKYFKCMHEKGNYIGPV